MYMRWHDSNQLVTVGVKLWRLLKATLRQVSPQERKRVFWEGKASMIAAHSHFWFSKPD